MRLQGEFIECTVIYSTMYTSYHIPMFLIYLHCYRFSSKMDTKVKKYHIIKHVYQVGQQILKMKWTRLAWILAREERRAMHTPYYAY